MAALHEAPATVAPSEGAAPGQEPVPADIVEHKRTVGPVTTGAGAGSILGGALATLVVSAFKLDLDVTGIAALTTVISAVLAFAGGYLVPSQKAQLQAQAADALALTLTERTEIAEAAARNAASLAIPDVRGLVAEEVAKAAAPDAEAEAEAEAEDDDRSIAFEQYPTAS